MAKQILKCLFGAILIVILALIVGLARSYIMQKVNNLEGPRINLNENLSPTQRAREGLTDVYLMPFYGFPESLAGAIAAKFYFESLSGTLLQSLVKLCLKFNFCALGADERAFIF